jgi:hypothetical protein
VATQHRPDPSSPLDDPHHRAYPKLSADDVAMAKLMNIYHWADYPACSAENCVGYDHCVYAKHMSIEGMRAVADAVQQHVNHRLAEGLGSLRKLIQIALADGDQL